MMDVEKAKERADKMVETLLKSNIPAFSVHGAENKIWITLDNSKYNDFITRSVVSQYMLNNGFIFEQDGVRRCYPDIESQNKGRNDKNPVQFTKECDSSIFYYKL